MPVTALLLVRPLIRAVPWGPPAAAAVLSALAVLPAVAGDHPAETGPWGLRIAALLFGAAASFALVDRMAPLTVVPTPRWVRQWMRLAVSAVPAVTGWLVLLAVVRSAGAVPGGGIAVEAAVCGLTGVAGAAVAARHRHSTTAALAGPGTQAVLMAAGLFGTGTHSPWPAPDEPFWSGTHRYWAAALPVLAVVLVLANRDTWPLRPGRARA